MTSQSDPILNDGIRIPQPISSRINKFQSWISDGQLPQIFSAKIKLLTACNLDCSFCPWRVSNDAAKVKLTLSDLRQPISDLAEMGLYGIHFSGGEPLMHPELAAIIRYCKSVGIAKVSLTTNATLAKRDLISTLCDAGLESVNVSIDGNVSDLHASRANAFDRALGGLINFLSVRDRQKGSRLKVRVNMIIANKNLTQIPVLIEEFYKLAINGLHLIPIQDISHLLLNELEINWYRENILPVYRKLFDPQNEHRDPYIDSGAIRGEYVRDFYEQNKCFVPYLHTFIRANGEVHICCQRQERNAPLGNIHQQSIREIVLGRPYREERVRTDRHACKVCNMFTNFNSILQQSLSHGTSTKST